MNITFAMHTCSGKTHIVVNAIPSSNHYWLRLVEDNVDFLFHMERPYAEALVKALQQKLSEDSETESIKIPATNNKTKED